MATKIWTPAAPAVAQVTTLVFSGAPAAGSTITITINSKALVVTMNTAHALADVANAVANAFMATAPIVTVGSLDATSNFGGQTYGEFAKLLATSDNATTVTLTNTSTFTGYPVTVACAVTGGSLAVANTTPTAATGPMFWSNAANWSTGSVPASGDKIVYQNSAVDCRFGLPAIGANLRVDMDVYQSYTGKIGLSTVNVDVPAKSYPEYLPLAPVLSEGSSAADCTWNFGLGVGAGSPMMNFAYSSTGQKPVITVMGTGRPTDQSLRALNLSINSGVTNTPNVLAGSSVRFTDQLGQANKVSGFTMGPTPAGIAAAQVTGENNTASAATYTISGGSILIAGPAPTAATYVVMGGTVNVAYTSTGGSVPAVTISGDGRMAWNNGQTITAVVVLRGGTFDLNQASQPVTITNLDLYSGAHYWDANGRATYTNGIDLEQCNPADIDWQLPNNKKYTLGTVT
jgi:hypothetical protein